MDREFALIQDQEVGMYHEPSVRFREQVLEGDVGGAREQLDKGVHVDVRGMGGYTALIDAAQHGDRAMLALLLDRDADIDGVEGTHGETALYHAMTADHLDAARFLIERGADLTVGLTAPIRAAIEQHRPDWLRFLIAAGLDVNAETTFSEPLLMAAVDRGSHEMVTLLLEAGADPNQSDGSPFTALRLAVEGKREEIIETLISSGARVDLELAARAGLVGLVKELIANGANPDAVGEWRQTPLQAAIRRRHLDVVRVLIELGVDVNAGEDRQPLELAQAGGLTEIVAVLRAAGATEAGDSTT